MTRAVLIASLVAFALAIFAVVDIAIIERERVRRLPKAVWIILAIVVPVAGPVLWFFYGRVRPRHDKPGRTIVGPDDDPAFLAQLRRDEEAEQRIRDLEQQLRDLDDDKPKE